MVGSLVPDGIVLTFPEAIGALGPTAAELRVPRAQVTG